MTRLGLSSFFMDILITLGPFQDRGSSLSKLPHHHLDCDRFSFSGWKSLEDLVMARRAVLCGTSWISAGI